MRFAFIGDHRSEFPVGLMCRVLHVTRSGFYAWCVREPSVREPSVRQQRQVTLDTHIRQVHQESRAVYGSPRVHRELHARGVACCENTVAKRMRACGIRSKTRRRFVVRTTDSRHDHPVAENKLDRQFQQARPNQAWAADITYIPTQEGWLYLAAVIDLCSRKIVGWATAAHLRSELACDAFQGLLARYGMCASMSRSGNCYDNAVMESFFGTLKTELVYHESYPTHEAARQSLFEYIEVFYNRQRRHSALGYLSPTQFEARPN